MALPEGWFTPEAIRQYAVGIIIGAIGATIAVLRVIKSGTLVFGDKVTVLVENAKLKEQVARKDKEIANLKEQLKAQQN